MDGAIRDFRSSWKSLVLTDIAFKVLAFIVLTPLLGVLFRTLIATSGSAVVSDLDILFFFLGPVGWICGIVVGALWLAIVALEQASLLAIICAKSADKDLGPVAALRFAAGHAWSVIRVTIRIVALTLLAIAPLLAVAAAIYFTLLTEYDINYYLQERPPVFRVAVGIGAVMAAALVVLLLRLFSSWFFALPLVLFEEVTPREALKVSAARAHGHRRTLIGWIIGWALVMAVLSALATGAVGLVGRLLTPESTESLHLLAVTIGVTLLLWSVVNLAVNLLSTTTFAAILFNLYRGLGRDNVAGTLPADSMADIADAKGFQITRKRLLAVGIIGIVIAVGVGGLALQSVRLDDDVKIMAHRGSSQAAPENTMAAFQRAIEDGADWIELDVQETADGEVVVLHDSDFMKLAGVDRKIWDATLSDLKEIDIGSWFAPEFKDERVPTLAEVLDECKRKIRVNIELKYYGHDEQLEQRVADIVDAHDMAADVVAMSLKLEGVKKMKSIRPDWKVGLLMSVSAGDLNKLDADFLAVNAGFANRRLIRTAHENGKEVYVWTVNDAPTMSTMISRGVDGLLTDKPALAKSVLEQRAQMSVPERVLLELAGLLGSVSEIGEQ
jgi:glycerophosphoryl diester phosphodiesterase